MNALLVGATTVAGGCAALVADGCAGITGMLDPVMPCFAKPMHASLLQCLAACSMGVDLLTTVVVGSLVGMDGDSCGSDAVLSDEQPHRIWPLIFAALTKMAARSLVCDLRLGRGGVQRLGGLYRATVHAARQFIHARRAADRAAAVQALGVMAMLVDEMRGLGGDAGAAGAASAASAPTGFETPLAVVAVWVRFEAAALGEGEIGKRLGEFFAAYAARDLGEYELHALCWLLDGAREQFDEAEFQRVVEGFRRHGLEVGNFEERVALGCGRICALFG
jgi:hypothetical protein